VGRSTASFSQSTRRSKLLTVPTPARRIRLTFRSRSLTSVAERLARVPPVTYNVNCPWTLKHAIQKSWKPLKRNTVCWCARTTTDIHSRNRISIWSTLKARYYGFPNEPGMAIRLQIQFVCQATIALNAPRGMDLIVRLTLRTESCFTRPSQSKSLTLQWKPTLHEGRTERPLRSEMTGRSGSTHAFRMTVRARDDRPQSAWDSVQPQPVDRHRSTNSQQFRLPRDSTITRELVNLSICKAKNRGSFSVS